MGSLLNDLRFTLRLWRSRLLTSLAAVICLALGIGATTVIFGLVDTVLLRPLPFEDADELVTLWNDFTGQGIERSPVSGPEFLDLKEQATTLEDIAGYIAWTYNLTGDGEPERLSAARVSSSLFRMLGQTPAQGRVFAPDEEKREEKVVIISHALFARRFGSDPEVIGTSISFDGVPYTVIGVMPAAFRFLSDSTQVWVPLEINPRIRRDQRGVRVIARRADGINLVQAQADADGIAARLAEAYPGFYPPEAGHRISVVSLREVVVGDVRPLLLTLMAAVALVLLIACSNVANLMLAQIAVRERELSLRAALGAGRPRLIGQLLTESLMLAGTSGLAGIGLAYLGTTAIVRLGLGDLPRLTELSVDARVLAFAVAASAVTGVGFGLVPALKSSQIRVVEALAEEGRSSSGGRTSILRRALVVAQIALALVVLVGTGLLLRSFRNLQQVDPGFHSQGLLSAHFALPFQRYLQRPQRLAFVDRMLEELEHAPEVASAAAVSILPFSGAYQYGDIEVIGRAREQGEASPSVGWRMASAGYFETLGIPLLRGRTFTDLDHAEATPVVIVDQSLAARLWPAGDPLGQRLQLIGAIGGDTERTVVGVVGAVNELSLERANELLYVPFHQRPTPSLAIVMRTRGEPESATGALRAAARKADADLPIIRIATVDELIDSSLAQRRFNRLMFCLFGGTALLLTSIGVYSLMAYSVTQRRREIGLRTALGATPESVRTLILGHSLRLAAMGIVGGVILALAMTRLFAGTLNELTFGIGLADLSTYVAVFLLLAGLAMVASYVPAWTASRVDPIIALRQD